MLYIGIDLGTSAVKILLMKDGGRVLKTVSESYPVNFPQTGWSEQNPKRSRRNQLRRTDARPYSP